MASNKSIQSRFEPSNKKLIFDLQLVNSNTLLDVKYLEEEVIFLDGSILLKPLIQND